MQALEGYGHQSRSGGGPTCVEGGSPAKLSLSLSAGFVSWRDPKSGSWYIETLDSIFEQWAHCEDLQTLLLRVRLLEGQCVLPRVGVSRAPSPSQRFLLQAKGLP